MGKYYIIDHLYLTTTITTTITTISTTISTTGHNSWSHGYPPVSRSSVSHSYTTVIVQIKLFHLCVYYMVKLHKSSYKLFSLIKYKNLSVSYETIYDKLIIYVHVHNLYLKDVNVKRMKGLTIRAEYIMIICTLL